MTTLHITSDEQLQELCREAETIILSIQVKKAGGQKVVTVTTFDGRSGVRVVKGEVTGDLTEEEWQLAFIRCVASERASGSNNRIWCDWTAHRFPSFAQVAAERPVAAIRTYRSSYGLQPGMADEVGDAARPVGEQWRTLLVRSVRFLPADEVNERDDDLYEITYVEPTDNERSAPFVRWVAVRAQNRNAHERDEAARLAEAIREGFIPNTDPRVHKWQPTPEEWERSNSLTKEGMELAARQWADPAYRAAHTRENVFYDEDGLDPEAN